jgi:hypothetical protein
MKVLGQLRLVDVLGEWGIHEGQGRGRDQFPAEHFEGPDRLLNGVDVALIYRSPLTWRILRGVPIVCVRVEIAPEDVPALRIADGRKADDWTSAVLTDQGDSGAHVRVLAGAVDLVAGPLVCTAQTAGGTQVRSPVVIFDGWHRAAAWISQLRGGAAYPITSSLVITRDAVPLLGTL